MRERDDRKGTQANMGHPSVAAVLVIMGPAEDGQPLSSAREQAMMLLISSEMRGLHCDLVINEVMTRRVSEDPPLLAARIALAGNAETWIETLLKDMCERGEVGLAVRLAERAGAPLSQKHLLALAQGFSARKQHGFGGISAFYLLARLGSTLLQEKARKQFERKLKVPDFA